MPNEHDFISLLEFIDAPQHLQHVLFPLAEFPEITSILKKSTQGPLWKWLHQEIDAPTKTCEQFNAQKDKIIEHLSDDVILWIKKAPGTFRNSSFRNINKTNPLFSTLGHRPRISKHRDQYHQLQAHALIAYLCFTRELNRIEAHDKLLFDGLAAVRSLTQKEHLREFPKLPSAPCSPEQYLRKITVDTPKSFRIHQFAKVLKQAIAFNKNSHNDVGRVANETIPQEDNQVAVTYKSHPYRDSENDRVQEFLHEPLHAAYQLKNSYDILSRPEQITRKSPDHYSHNITQASKKIAKANQFLNFDWSELADYDVTCLINEISKGQNADPKEILANAYLHLMFWAGQNAAAISKLIIDSESITNSYCRDGFIRLVSKGPQLKKKEEEYKSVHRVDKQDHLDLPLPKCATEAINHAIIYKPDLFSESSQQIIQYCKIRISSIKDKHSAGRLTLSRIWQYQFRLLSRMPNCDISTAALTLNRADYLARTKIHYSTFDSEFLQEKFRESCHQILQKTGNHSEFSPALSFQRTKHVGTPFRLKATIIIDTVHKLQEDIRQQLEKISRNEATNDNIILYHNNYSTYTALLLCFATGHRRAKTPYISSKEWDPLTQFGSIRDKDSADYQHSRLVWIPDVCIEQMRCYREHIQNMYQILGLQVSADQPAPPNHPEFFFIKNKRAYIDYNTFAKNLTKLGYDFESHPQRHFLKSEMQERGCDPEMLEAYLGHWNTGQEPWVRSSSLHPIDFKKELEKFLPPLLRSLDFKAIEGLTSTTDHSIKVSFPAKTRPGYRAKNSTKSTSQILLSAPPGEIWLDLLPTARRFQQGPAVAFRTDQLKVLEQLEIHLPEIYKGEKAPPVTDQKMIELIKKIVPKRTHPEKRLRRLQFLYQGLRAGSKSESLKWETPYPHVPKAIATEKNRIRPGALRRLHKFRKLEKAFLKDLKRPIPRSRSHRIGQIILSAILYGGLLHQKWINSLPAALEKGFYQYADWLWLDLENIKRKEDSPKQRFDKQSNPEAFRRWFPDPLTQLLIYRWIRFGGDREKRLDRSAWKTVSSYLTTLNIEQPKTLLGLLIFVRPYYTLTLPSFLCCFAENNLPSASLPDPVWLRSLTGSLYTVPFKKKAFEKNAAIKPPNDYSTQRQRELLKELKSNFETYFLSGAKTEGAKRNAAKKGIEVFLEKNKDQLCPVLQLLTDWAYQLLNDRESPKEGRQLDALQTGSVQSYITEIGEVLIAVAGDLNLLDFGITNYIDLYEHLGEMLHYKERAISRLKQFHKFLVYFYDQPEIDGFDHLSRRNQHLYARSVSANYFTVQQYRDILERLGWGKENLTRNETMSLVAFIICYWTGMRKEEVHGLSLADVQTTIETLEFQIFPNDFRGLKTVSATRRNPQDLIDGGVELEFVREWIKRRHLESPKGQWSKVPLFTKSQLSNQLIGDNALFGKVRQDIKVQLQDQSAVWHHLRDSALQTYYLKLLCRDDIPMERKPYFLDDECFSSANREHLQSRLFPNDRSGRKILFGAATLIGHADSLEGFKSYFHLTDWLLGYYVRHPGHLPALSSQAYSALTAEKVKYSHIGRSVPPSMLYSSIRKQHRAFEQSTDNLIHKLLPHGIPVPKKRGRKPIESGIFEFDVAYYKMQLAGKTISLRSNQELTAAKHIYENIHKLSLAKQRKFQELFNDIQESYINHRKDMKYLQFTDREQTVKTIKLLSAIEINMNLSKITYHESRYKKNGKKYSQWNKALEATLNIGENCQIKDKRECVRITNSALNIPSQDEHIDILDIVHFLSISINMFKV